MATDRAPRQCGARPPAGQPHGGQVDPCVSVCPSGHLRTGYSCEACRGRYGAVLCGGCDGGEPAVLIPAGIFRAMPFGSVLASLRELEAPLDAPGPATAPAPQPAARAGNGSRGEESA